ncbi:glycosyl transferases group 1 family protein [Francisella philomiragia subsp. philomiragia ATCC 25015]|uniref:CgeB family protein n=1 Tax=Francisella philomiragia TaxID=28110 RepID=UPI0001AF7898|nr:glycosyltransferase [Francisella philomiragia]AJI74176.1 glycosyl transferases group 1 family protein [Francisella philomiragia subsp. philomiragia ATCC 25015]EET20933.1 conserved hypothetical protein [Francisella philomiragia subsp. philomiragia ATCC 25015]MBK2238177.1 glycosyltransferase family 1 protein [Francisella philomiragia]
MVNLKIAIIADQITTATIGYEDNCTCYNITPLNYKFVFKIFKPDLFFVESAWQGYRNSWKFKIASYPEHPKRSNVKLIKVVDYAKRLGIPTVFWNKEDCVHFDRFIDSAKHFEHIFTVDENCIPKYQEVVSSKTTVNTMMFAVQPKIHYFKGFDFKHKRANFAGSYSHHIHSKRRKIQDIMFESVCSQELGLTVFDRNSERNSENYRYPELENMNVEKAVSHSQTAQIYRDYMLSLNVNTIEDSPTMFSRRLIEILACGGVAITNNTLAVQKMFSKYCHVIETKQQIDEIVERVTRDGLSDDDLAMAKAGSEYVLANFTWTNNLDMIKQVVGLK